ncbi:hypothetical protein LAUMK13_02197 [Mycobacterium innocens]|uniref:Uncharacterized protein n=1 Tax=Mycobacterium innocens TaxID=2341083 RepID=A0A498Q2S2_9MYCO|nr:hypothetical protein LAUMK13_02197 [Mycobacterium innocens]
MAQVGGGVGGSPISVIARQMDTIRDQFIAEVFDTMKSEIQGLDYDSRMMDMWQASITENYVAAVHYLERDAPTSLLEAPPAALAYARAARSVMCRWRRWFGRIDSAMHAFSRWPCSMCRCWNPRSECRPSPSW